MNKGVFVCRCLSSENGRQASVYAAGMLFALGWWAFVDGLSFASTQLSNRPAGFEDWVSGLVATLGMTIVHLIDKETLHASDDDDHKPWRARLFLFMGFALLAGGLAGSVAVLVVKYIMHHLEGLQAYVGICGVVQTSLIMASTAVLWISQYHYDQPHFSL